MLNSAPPEPLDRFLLTSKIALITGASRGLGKAMALAFAQAGADLVVCSRKLEACRAVADEIVKATGRRALPVACHVGRWQDLQTLVDAAYQHFGRVDILVNNAGMSPIYGQLVDVSEALYDKVMDVNLKGPFRLTALIGSRMVEGNGGSIVNISAAVAAHPIPSALPYSAAKAGLNALTKGFAQALAPKVRVNAIMPGAFLTDISTAWDLDAVRSRVVGHGLGRLGEPAEIVGAALYFASDASSYTTGAVVAVDGGLMPQ